LTRIDTTIQPPAGIRPTSALIAFATMDVQSKTRIETAIHIVTNHDHRTVTSTNGGQSMTNGRLKNGTTVSDPISANRQGAQTRTMRNL